MRVKIVGLDSSNWNDHSGKPGRIHLSQGALHISVYLQILSWTVFLLGVGEKACDLGKERVWLGRAVFKGRLLGVQDSPSRGGRSIGLGRQAKEGPGAQDAI